MKEIKLSEKQEKDVVTYFTRVITATLNSRTSLDNVKIPEYWQRYRGDWSSKKDKNVPWEGSADVNIPFITWACTSNESRMMNAIFGGNKIAEIVPTSNEAEDAATIIDKYVQYTLVKEINYEDKKREGVQRLNVEGTEFQKVVCENKKITLPKYEFNKSIGKYIMETVESIVDGLKKLLPTNKLKIINSNEKIKFTNDVYIVPLKDMLWWGGNDIQTCEGIAQRLYMSVRNLQDKVKTDKWINIEQMYGNYTQSDKGQEDKDKKQASGFTEDDNYKVFTPFEIYAYYDIDGDGNYEHCVLVIDIDKGVLLHYRQNDNFWGLRPYTVTPLFYISGMLNGQGFPERLAIPSDELNTLHNQALDNSTMINAQVCTYFRNRLENKVDTFKIKPGMMIPVTAEGAITSLQMAPRALDLAYQQDFVKDIMERLAIVNDNTLGREINIERPTARGKQMSLAEYAVNFDILIRNLAIGIKSMVDIMLKNLYQYMPSEGIEFPVLDKNNKYLEVPSDPNDPTSKKQLVKVRLMREHLEFINDIDIKVTANSVNAIKGLAVQNIIMLYDRFIQDKSGETSSFELKRILAETIDKNIADKVMREPEEILKMRQMFEQIQQKMQMVDQASQQNLMKEQHLTKREELLAQLERAGMNMAGQPQASVTPTGETNV